MSLCPLLEHTCPSSRTGLQILVQKWRAQQSPGPQSEVLRQLSPSCPVTRCKNTLACLPWSVLVYVTPMMPSDCSPVWEPKVAHHSRRPFLGSTWRSSGISCELCGTWHRRTFHHGARSRIFLRCNPCLTHTVSPVKGNLSQAGKFSEP